MEDRCLTEDLLAGVPVAEVAAHLGRTEHAVLSRASTLRIHLRGGRPAQRPLDHLRKTAGPETYKGWRWSEREDQQLRELARAGKSINDISKQIGRPVGSVRARAEKLSVRIAKTTPRLRLVRYL